MKNTLTFFICLAACMMSMTSCIKDLDVLPLNPTDTTAETAYGAEEDAYLSGLAKIYNTLYDCWSVSGLANSSQGSSCCSYWMMNECSTDTMMSAWEKEVWTNYFNYNSWGAASFDQTHGLYAYALLGATFTNEYLNQTTDEKLKARGCSDAVIAKVHSMRAEARILRAYHYYMLVDIFGQMGFVDETNPIGKNPPVAKTRTEAFNWVVGELEALVASPDTPSAASNYPRVDKGTCLGLLVRLYLNAEVWAGTPMWKEAKATCEEIFKNTPYELCPEYAWIFRGDNGENPAAKQEIMFANFQDTERTAWNWGGATLIIASAQDINMVQDGCPLGFKDYWGGLRMPYEYVERFFKPTGVDYETGEYTIEDKRGQLFYIKGREEKITNPYNFNQGWGVHKYNNIPHDKTAEEYKDQGMSMMFANTDVVYMRLGEMYLAYAEACLQLGEPNTGLPYLNKLRTRAGVSAVTSYDEEFLFEEYSRELYWEGGRRRDLIRWDKFSSGDYLWPWKGGNLEGQSFSKHLEIFNLPTRELQANPNLQPNPGY